MLSADSIGIGPSCVAALFRFSVCWSHAQCAFSAARQMRRAGGRAPYEKNADYLNFLPTYSSRAHTHASLHSTALAHFFPLSVVSSTTFLPTGAAGDAFPPNNVVECAMPAHLHCVGSGRQPFFFMLQGRRAVWPSIVTAQRQMNVMNVIAIQKNVRRPRSRNLVRSIK